MPTVEIRCPRNRLPCRSSTCSGEWTLRQAGKKEVIKATVPGTVHTDLLAAGKIPDPYYQDNEDRVQWIGEADWVYKRTFTVPKDYLLQRAGSTALRRTGYAGHDKNQCHEIARTDNMFRTYEFDVKNILKPG